MTGEQQEANWPVAKFLFSVDIADVGTNLKFQEVSGLELETQPIEYRRGSSPAFSSVRMPGIQKYGNITLKKGVFAKDNTFFDWYDKVKRNTITRTRVTIRLLDEGGHPIMTWILANAWPTKVASADLRADGNEVAVETIELAHEGLTIEAP